MKNGHGFTHSLCLVTCLIYVQLPQLCLLKAEELLGQMGGQVDLWTAISLSMHTWDVCVFHMSNCKYDIFAYLSHNIYPNICPQQLFLLYRHVHR